MYGDFIQLRLNTQGTTRGLCGQNVDVHHVDQANELVAFRRWDQGGPGDDVLVIINFSNQSLKDYEVAFPGDGVWRLRLNTDWDGYSDQFDNLGIGDVTVRDGRTNVKIAPYSVLVFSQDEG